MKKSEMQIPRAYVVTFLARLGVPANIKGYEYIKLALYNLLAYPEMLYQVTKVLYPSVAQLTDTTAARVERAMRHAIKVTFERTPTETIEQMLGTICANHKPTNSEFLGIVADKIRLDTGYYNFRGGEE